LILLFPATSLPEVFAAPSMNFNWDREVGQTQAVVKDSAGLVMAETPWPGGVPVAWDTEEDEMDVPVLLLAQLRDELVHSSAPEAPEAWQFVRDLMGTYADTVASEIPNKVDIAVSYTDVDVNEWCGAAVDSLGECADPQGMPNSMCSGFACRATELAPLE